MWTPKETYVVFQCPMVEKIKKMAWGKTKEKEKFREPILDDDDEEQEGMEEPEEPQERGRRSHEEPKQEQSKSRALTPEEIDYLIDGTLNRLANLISIRRRM